MPSFTRQLNELYSVWAEAGLIGGALRAEVRIDWKVVLLRAANNGEHAPPKAFAAGIGTAMLTASD